jgi:hypothetical protein
MMSPAGDTGKYRLHFTLLDDLFSCNVDECLFLSNSVDVLSPFFFNLEVHKIMEILNKLVGGEDLTVILPEDGEQTDEESGDEVDREINCLPQSVLRTNIEVNLKSESYDFKDPYEKEPITLQVCEERDSNLPYCKKKPKTVARKPTKWSAHENTLQAGLEEET